MTNRSDSTQETKPETVNCAWHGTQLYHEPRFAGDATCSKCAAPAELNKAVARWVKAKREQVLREDTRGELIAEVRRQEQDVEDAITEELAAARPSGDGRPAEPFRQCLLQIPQFKSEPLVCRLNIGHSGPCSWIRPEEEAEQPAIAFVLGEASKRRCDSEGVADCVRCNSIFLAKKMKEFMGDLARTSGGKGQ